MGKKEGKEEQSSFGMTLVCPCDKGVESVDANKKKVGIWARNKLTYIG